MAAGSARRSRSRASGSAARAAAGCRGRRRCSSDRGRARRRAAGDQTPNITTSVPTWSSVGGIFVRPAGTSFAVSPSRSSCAASRRSRWIWSHSDDSSPAAGHDLPFSLEHEAVAVGADRGRSACSRRCRRSRTRRAAVTASRAVLRTDPAHRRSRSRAGLRRADARERTGETRSCPGSRRAAGSSASARCRARSAARGESSARRRRRS